MKDIEEVIAERDEALLQLENITANRDFEKKMKAKARIQRDVQTAKAADLQQRLTAADEREDVLKGQVSMLLRELQELINDEDGILVAAELSTGFAWHSLQKHGKAIKATLKAAEGRNEPNCLRCLDKKTVPSNLAEGYVMDCPDCCGDEG